MFGLTIITTKTYEELKEISLSQFIKDRNTENLLFKKEREILKLKKRISELEEQLNSDIMETPYGEISLEQAQNFIRSLKISENKK